MLFLLLWRGLLIQIVKYMLFKYFADSKHCIKLQLNYAKCQRNVKFYCKVNCIMHQPKQIEREGKANERQSQREVESIRDECVLMHEI